MCGIFGLIHKKPEFNLNSYNLINELFTVSESRGQDASGISISYEDRIYVLKMNLKARDLVRLGRYQDILEKNPNWLALIGHARMETNGTYTIDDNNQPVVKDGIITIHNGIVVNDGDLWERFPDLKRKYEVDTEVINSLLRKFLNETGDLLNSYKKTLNLLEGSFSLASFVDKSDNLLLSTNTGSLYILKDGDDNAVLFASEFPYVDRIYKKYFPDRNWTIEQINAGSGALIDIKSGKIVKFNISDIDVSGGGLLETSKQIQVIENIQKSIYTRERTNVPVDFIEREFQKNQADIKNLKRCTKCILPETMPFIEFDINGVCNYCRNFMPKNFLGEATLKNTVYKYKASNRVADCIVSFSGGRDSSYSLHYVKNILGLKPIAFSYDWGMLTPLGRRNQARMTGSLGIEHILISANITKKRNYIKSNVEAWLKKPHLGTIPLFMAGDKQYFYYANKIKQTYNLDLLVMGENYLEKTTFKNGFANVIQDTKGSMAYNVSGLSKLKMLFFYANQYITNPAYLNSSIIDTFGAYLSYFVLPHNYLNLFDYIEWDEEVINKTLLENYDWEISPDTNTTWRIGDGTASFYNYIYYTVAGFSENDTFRSNQIRYGKLTRKEALEKSLSENIPRIESIKWYCDTIDVDMENAVKVINSIPKIYK